MLRGYVFFHPSCKNITVILPRLTQQNMTSVHNYNITQCVIKMSISKFQLKKDTRNYNLLYPLPLINHYNFKFLGDDFSSILISGQSHRTYIFRASAINDHLVNFVSYYPSCIKENIS